jgi:hypothetical protein
MITVMGCDMGTRNFGVTVTKAAIVDGVFKFKIVGTCMMHAMIRDVKQAQKEAELFKAEFARLPKVDYIAAERFQMRPGGRGNRAGAGSTVESISMMLGVMLCERADTPIQFYTAATWKNAFNRTAADLKEMYEDTKNIKDFAIHQIDSTLISIYHACKILGCPPYPFIKSYKHEKEIVKRLLAAPNLLGKM